MNDSDRALCVATAGLLRASGAIAGWGLALSLIAGLVLALTGRSLPTASWAAFAAVGLIGLPERYLSLRVYLDARLFEALARGTIANLTALDGALETLGLRRAAEAVRPLAERVLGTRQLVQRHGLLVAAQTVVFILALVLQD
ncbi:hypothetical protein [Variovorax saccharolyticus]|uniref:hypothetical protein n=1 Tax=Variovorax saccharolyticus TaxID=3053516 RepID=UPI002578197A|nr:MULTISPECIES: hypothetical protein [unclassified Variovorax]MDM0020520.1 hypothetical protein [Variovorax sp. J22R187]MDM0025940.1 hypothetical protein [Variovorax sp. J31P216]